MLPFGGDNLFIMKIFIFQQFRYVMQYHVVDSVWFREVSKLSVWYQLYDEYKFNANILNYVCFRLKYYIVWYMCST